MGSRHEIITSRLELWQLHEEDLPLLYELLKNPTMTVYRETDFTDQEIRDLVLDSLAAIDNGLPGLRLIVAKEDHRPLGVGGVKRGVANNRDIYEAFMYLLLYERGKGYAREALSALTQDALNKGAEEVHSFIGVDNYPMQFLLEYVGYVRVGVETINLDYSIVTRAHYVYRRPTDGEIHEDDVFFFPTSE